MINDGPLARFAPLAGGLVKPIYADYSFGNIPATIEFLLTGNRREPLLPPDCFGGEPIRARRRSSPSSSTRSAGSSGSSTSAAFAPPAA